MNRTLLAKTPALILCGGLGSRLKTVVSDRPKPMAQINQRPFLDLLLTHLALAGIKEIILSIGHMSSVIQEHYQKLQNRSELPFNLKFSIENNPLGTAGGIKQAEQQIESENFFVLNGDSHCPVDLNKMHSEFITKKTKYMLAITEAKELDGQQFGTIAIDKLNGEVNSFQEKSQQADPFINVGVYLFNRTIFNMIEEEKKVSLEKEIFQKIITTNGPILSFHTHETLIDIGTEDRFAKAMRYFQGAKYGF